MATEQPSDLPVVVKEEPPEEQPEVTSFCSETVNKEEVIIEDEVEHANDQQKSVSNPQTKSSRKRSYECPECNRTFNKLEYRNKCVKRHNAIKVELYKCKFCGKLSGTSNNHRRHEAIHKKGTKEMQPDVLDSEQGKSEDDPPQKPKSVKEEPPEEQPEVTSFCYDTVTKEEVILEDEEEHVDDRPKSVSDPQTVIARKRSFECPECNRTFNKLVYRNRCVKRHNAIRLELYKCKFCGKFSGTLYGQRRHEATHKKGTKELQPVSVSEQGKFEDDPPQKEDSSKDSMEEEKAEEPNASNDRNLVESLTEKMLEENDIFKCSECNRTFDEADALRRCKNRHQAIKLELYKCNTCGKCEYSKHNLARHVNTHKKEMQQAQLVRDAPLSEEGGKWFKCSECNRAFRDLYMATRCEKKHLAVRLGLYECRFCKMRVGTLVDLKRHEQVRHITKAGLAGQPKSKPFVCDKCGMCYAKKETIQKHVCSQEAEEVRFTCHKCYADFPTRQNLLLHIKRHNWNQTKHEYFAKLAKDDKGNHLCTICKQSFINQQTATCHVFRHMNLIEGLFVCKTCGVKCRDNREYKIHIQIHTKPEEVPKTSEKNQPLEETDENLSKESDALNESSCFDARIKEELIIADDEFGESAQGEQKEDSRKLLEDHQPRVKQEEEPSEPIKGKGATQKKFKCDICQKGFGRKCALQKHKKIHEKECQRSQYEDFMLKGKDGYTCLLCGSTFRKRNTATTDIRRHMNVIEGIFKCNICGLRSGKKHEHQLHIKTHKSTSDQRALPRDIEGVHSDYTASSNVACEKSDLPLHCKTCNVFFNNKTNLNVHLWTSKLKFIRMKTAAVEGEPSDGIVTRPT